MSLRILSIISLLILVGCATPKPTPLPPKPVVIKEYIYPNCGNPPKRSEITYQIVHWDWFQDSNGNTSYSLTPKEYEHLSYNVSMTIKAVKELRIEIIYYMDCINDGRN